MDEIYVYYVQMPQNVSEMVTPCYDGYTIYIDANLSDNDKYKAFIHALKHIANNDFNGNDVNNIEYHAHLGGAQ